MGKEINTLSKHQINFYVIYRMLLNDTT